MEWIHRFVRYPWTAPGRIASEYGSSDTARVWIMVVYATLVYGGLLTVGYNGVAKTLFVSRLPASDMPWAFILPAAGITPGLLIYNRLAARYRPVRLIVASLLGLAAVGLFFRVLVVGPLATNIVLLGAFFLYCEFITSLGLLQFWTLAAQIFDPRRARRRFGLITAGGTGAIVVAGLGMATLTRYLGVENLILVLVASLIICAACARALSPWLKLPPADQAAAARPSFVDDIRQIRRIPLLQTIAALTVLTSLLMNIGSYQFLLALQQHFAHRDTALVIYLGSFAIWTGLLALVVQVYVTSRVLTRFGAVPALVLLPVATTVASLTALATGGALWTIAAVRGTDPALRRTVTDSALNALYVPLPARLRRQVKSLFESLYALTFGLAGVVFLVSQRLGLHGYLPWSVPVLACGAVWFLVLARARTRYARVLAEALDRRRLMIAPGELELTDKGTIAVLTRALAGPDPRHVVHVLEILAGAPAAIWQHSLVPLLGHESAAVRAQALRCLTSMRGHMIPDIAGLADDHDADVRVAAIQAIAGLSPADTHQLRPLLHDQDWAVKAVAVVALAASQNDQDAEAALSELHAMITGPPAARREAATALGRLAGMRPPPAVATIFGPPPPESPTTHPFIHALLSLLPDPAAGTNAVQAIAAYGDHAVPALGACAGDDRFPPAGRIRACVALQKIGTPSAARALLHHLAIRDLAVRSTVYRALAHLLRASPQPIDVDALRAQTHAELRQFYEIALAERNLSLPAHALLRSVLIERRRAILGGIIHLLIARYPAAGIDRVLLTADDDETQRAMAVELLDTVVDRSVMELLLPILEGPPKRLYALARATFGLEPRSRQQWLDTLARSDDRWIRACALAEIGHAHEVSLVDDAVQAVFADDAIVSEAGLDTCGRLLPSTELSPLIAGAVESPFPIVRRYAMSLERAYALDG
ncbi:MAG TPA: hypothetical protein VFA78_06010 [Chloroflexota bacterium]|nr:hypothetical protein [Chloroflexota bacterium]